MTISELRKKLLDAYEVNNLNRISFTLINLFKNRQYSVLQKIAEIIGELVTVTIRDNGKGFSGFMMLYHPDRAIYHVSEINKLAEQNNFDALLAYSHILKLERIEEIASSLNSFEDIDYSPVYDWDMETEGFTIFTDIRPPEKIKTTTKLIGYTYYDAIKLREFGNIDEEFPTYYLEDIDEFELSSSDINDLDGVQFCKHAKSIDLSNNRIADLSLLEDLTNLEDLNLSDNEISYIDGLGFLTGLRSLNLANNMIDDLEPLFGLKNLEYIDVSGNKVIEGQINILIKSGVAVDF